MTNSNRHDDDPVGYGRPPAATRFKPGRSGNPRGRPKGAKGTKATVKRVLMEKHRADPDGRGRTREYTALELTVMLLKTLAASGDQRAYKALMALDLQHSPQDSHEPIGFLIVPEVLTQEEWTARFTPKDGPPPFYDDVE